MDPKTARLIGRRLAMTKRASPPASPLNADLQKRQQQQLQQTQKLVQPTAPPAQPAAPPASPAQPTSQPAQPAQPVQPAQTTSRPVAPAAPPKIVAPQAPNMLPPIDPSWAKPTYGVGDFGLDVYSSGIRPALRGLKYIASGSDPGRQAGEGALQPAYDLMMPSGFKNPKAMSQEAGGVTPNVTAKPGATTEAQPTAMPTFSPAALAYFKQHNFDPASIAKPQAAPMPTFSPAALAYFKQHNFDPASIAGGAAGGAGVEGDLYKMDPKARAAHIRQQSMMYTGMTPAQYAASNDAMLAGLGRAHQARQTRRWIQNLFSAV